MKIPTKMKTAILISLRRRGYEVVKADGKQNLNIAEASNYDLETIRLASQISMQSTQRIWALISATKYVVNNRICGHFVECGVYKGSSALIIARTLKSMNINDRHIYLYDTFEGMTKPTDLDSKQGTQTLASDILASTPMSNGENVWARASLENVTQMLSSLDYPIQNFHLIKGDVLETLDDSLPESISLLRLDTDWYESTKKELEELYPLVAIGGVVIIDDYGHWSGSKLAVDQFLRDNELFPLLNYLDYAGRLWVKHL
jgi:hypothetical protein